MPVHLSKPLIFIGTIALSIAIAAADHAIKVDLRLSILEFIAVVLMAQHFGFRAGVALSIGVVAWWFWADLEYLALRQIEVPTWATALNNLIRLSVFVFIAFLEARSQKLLHQLDKLAYTDELTGLLNRRAFMAALGREFDRARRYRTSIALLYLDLDSLKSVNDNYSHRWGDALLQGLAIVLKRNTRSSDVVAKIGGDEFAILLPHCTEVEAQKLAGRIEAEFANEAEKIKLELRSHGCLLKSIRQPDATLDRIGVSIGEVAYGAGELPDAHTALSMADARMYEAKLARKGVRSNR